MQYTSSATYQHASSNPLTTLIIPFNSFFEKNLFEQCITNSTALTKPVAKEICRMYDLVIQHFQKILFIFQILLHYKTSISEDNQELRLKKQTFLKKDLKNYLFFLKTNRPSDLKKALKFGG